MPGLRIREADDAGLCVECRKAAAVGPCAACEGMICPDCCTMTTDPGGKSVICLSCARMVADVGRNKLERRSNSSKTTALMILAVLAVGVAIALLR